MLPIVAATLALTLAACGDDDEDSNPGGGAAVVTSPEPPATTETTTAEREREPGGTRIILADSEFGTMLFGADRQAIYIFERDPRNETVCYGECAEAWPPVYTDGDPVAGRGVRQDLLGTVKRRDGRTQVTYAGKPLYFYDHEEPGEVRCHNVNLNGGLWWVVGPDGRRRA